MVREEGTTERNWAGRGACLTLPTCSCQADTLKNLQAKISDMNAEMERLGVRKVRHTLELGEVTDDCLLFRPGRFSQ